MDWCPPAHHRQSILASLVASAEHRSAFHLTTSLKSCWNAPVRPPCLAKPDPTCNPPMLHRIVELFRTRRGLLFVAVGVILLSIGFAPSCRATKRPASPITGHVPNLSTGSSNLHFVVPRPTI